MEFGWINLFGAVIVVLILLPNIVYGLKTRGIERAEKHVPKLLIVAEQAGRYASILLMWLPLFVWKFGFGSAEECVAYFLLNGLLLLAYYLLWPRYGKKPSLKSGMALAIIPSVIFLISGLLLRHWALAAAAVLFGVSHSLITRITHK